MITAKDLKDDINKVLQELNQDMGMDKDVDSNDDDLDAKLNTLERLHVQLKLPITPAPAIPEEPSAVILDLCMLCLERKSDAVILDCGHSKICFFCAFKMYRTQNACHLCRQDISRVIKVRRCHGLAYQKVIGILQRYEDKFYYSDVSRELVKQLKEMHKQQQENNNNLDKVDNGKEFDLLTDLIDELIEN